MKKTSTLHRILALVLSLAMVFSLAACGGQKSNSSAESSKAESSAAESSVEESSAAESSAEASSEAEVKTYKVGICNFVDDASLNQIIENIENRLKEAETELNVKFDVKVDNCNMDSAVLAQIIANFQADKVDLMVGVATPVAMAMQGATEDGKTPVIFSAVSDPLSAGLVESLEKPGANITGTSDFLDTEAIMNLILAQNPDITKVGLLYDQGQDSSATPIAAAKEFLSAKKIEVVEYTGTNTEEIKLAVQSMIADGVKAVFTPSDNTVMAAELSIYEDIAKAGIQHYAGADSFALNGAFVGYGVDYANLGVETANMVIDVLVNGKATAELPVKTFDNGTATVNTEICEQLGLDLAKVKETFAPLCTKVAEIQTAESFS